MKYTVKPGRYGGKVIVPPSKSLLHRYMIMAALAEGKTVIDNFSLCEDTTATLAALHSFGVRTELQDGCLKVYGGKWQQPDKLINCASSASTLRFLIPAAVMSGQTLVFTGSESLMSRPLQLYEDLFDKYELNDNLLTVSDYKHPGEIHLAGNVSSQFFTGLLIFLPLLDHDSIIISDGYTESRDYIRMTVDCLSEFGIIVDFEGSVIRIRGQQRYKPAAVTADGDYSQASYWLALGGLNSEVTVKGLTGASRQPDRIMLEIIETAGGSLMKNEEGITVSPCEIKGNEVDCRDCPDLVMTLAVLGMFSKEKWILKNVQRLRYKESDRVTALCRVFTDLGARIKSDNDRIIIEGRTSLKHPVTVECYNDHRIIMAAAIAATMLEYPVTISDAEYVRKSYPDFLEILEGLKQ